MKRAIFLLLVCFILFLPVDVKAGCNDTELALYRECMIVSERTENILTSPGSYDLSTASIKLRLARQSR